MNPFFKAGLLALSLAAGFILSWECYWRSRGFIPTFNDDRSLWALKRKDAGLPPEKTTVFIGSSRIKFNLDPAEWKKMTGEEAVQLALVGTSPLLLLKDLAEDEDFKGKLVVDITESIFFSGNPAFHASSREAISHYHKQTAAEKISSGINMALESQLVFLEEKRFSLNTLLNDLNIPNRPGVFSMPPFPKGFDWTTYGRQTYMSEGFLNNPADIKWQTSIWEALLMGDPFPAADGSQLEDMLQEIRNYADQIRRRGGKIIFVRTPSSGPLAEYEWSRYPREKYWDALLMTTGSDGIHFRDFADTRDLVCPEWSHLSRKQAIDYTRHLARVLWDKQWFF